MLLLNQFQLSPTIIGSLNAYKDPAGFNPVLLYVLRMQKPGTKILWSMPKTKLMFKTASLIVVFNFILFQNVKNNLYLQLKLHCCCHCPSHRHKRHSLWYIVKKNVNGHNWASHACSVYSLCMGVILQNTFPLISFGFHSVSPMPIIDLSISLSLPWS